jgi:reverse gyrase
VIAYSESVVGIPIITFNWNPYFKNNADIEFIFYYSGKDRGELVEWMKRTGIQRPVLYDSEKVFHSKNVIEEMTSIVFNTKAGVVQFLENPSFSKYQDFLDELKE